MLFYAKTLWILWVLSACKNYAYFIWHDIFGVTEMYLEPASVQSGCLLVSEDRRDWCGGAGFRWILGENPTRTCSQDKNWLNCGGEGFQCEEACAQAAVWKRWTHSPSPAQPPVLLLISSVGAPTLPCPHLPAYKTSGTSKVSKTGYHYLNLTVYIFCFQISKELKN